jgi:hypothetical protein
MLGYEVLLSRCLLMELVSISISLLKELQHKVHTSANMWVESVV